MIPQSANNRVTVVTVAYNSMRVLPEMLASIPLGTRIVIVDNASSNCNIKEELNGRDSLQVIHNVENLGFGTACNIGAAQAQTEFLLFLNPDARLLDGSLDALVAAADDFPAASAFNPAITDNHNRPYFKRSSVLLQDLRKPVRGWPSSSREVAVLSGAALFVRRAAFEAVGGFDPKIFLYHEDDDISLRLKADCGPLYFVRGARVSHDGGNASPRSPEIAALKAFHMGCSRIYATRKHHILGAERKALLTALTQLASPVNLFSARKRAKQTAFLRGVLWAIRNRSG